MKLKTLVVIFALVSGNLFAQNENIETGIVGHKMSDFTLNTYQGEEFSMKDQLGKNVLLVVMRGQYKEGKWCSICNYQYADFCNLEETSKIREKYNLEVVFLLPYPKDSAIVWEQTFIEHLDNIEKWKNPEDFESLSEKKKKGVIFMREHFSTVLSYDEVPLTIPLLLDSKQEVSKGLGLLKTKEDKGYKGLQAVPAVYIIDKDGVLQFKYISQNTYDRPTAEYILSFIEKMND